MELGSGLGTGDGILEMLGSKLTVGFGDTLGFAEGGTRAVSYTHLTLPTTPYV